MFEIEMGEVLSYIMVMFGDIFVLLAVFGSVLLLFGSLVNWRDLAARGAAGGLGALGFTTWIFFNKLSSPNVADATNGWLVGLGNGLVGFLLVLAAVMWIGGFAMLVIRRLA